MCFLFLFVCLLLLVMLMLVVVLVVEVCDILLCYGLSLLVVNIVQIVCNEYWFWFCFFIDCDGCVVSLSVIEVECEYLVDNGLIVWQWVVGYWCESGMLLLMGDQFGVFSCMVLFGICYSDSDCCVFLIDNLWLVVFIFWVMICVGVFGFICLLCYIDYICVVYQNSGLYCMIDLVQDKFVLGDLFCFLCDCCQMLSYSGLVQFFVSGGVVYWKLYCEVVIVVNVGGDWILYLVGGNVMNMVVMCKLLLDCSGCIELLLVKVSVGDGVDLGCMLGWEDECSFNWQDWVVLLKLVVMMLAVLLVVVLDFVGVIVLLLLDVLFMLQIVLQCFVLLFFMIMIW